MNSLYVVVVLLAPAIIIVLTQLSLSVSPSHSLGPSFISLSHFALITTEVCMCVYMYMYIYVYHVYVCASGCDKGPRWQIISYHTILPYHIRYIQVVSDVLYTIHTYIISQFLSPPSLSLCRSAQLLGSVKREETRDNKTGGDETR